ncbi:hypothetical protein [Radiobacillus sp. PE A8.2]|uniref:hypothetical protein n=1 Tax=Radiobacillus sp. PE A8.2 TaxID=3380349 RepID=UPI00388D8774
MTKKKRAGRNIRINVSEYISHMEVSEKEYKLIEAYYESDSSDCGINILTPKDK